MVRQLMDDEPEVAGRKSRWNKDSVTVYAMYHPKLERISLAEKSTALPPH